MIETWKNDFRAFVNSLNLSRDDYKTMMEYINEVPAAQPDHNADSSKMVCVDAISRQETIHAISDWIYDTTDERLPETVIRSLSAVQPEPHWIPCSDRLPEEQRYCLTSCRNGLVCEDFHWNNGYFDKADKYHHEVIAWMPLPKPYRGGDSNE